jgi:enoyl-[acyl-carrier-protein] reductase (NADH)
MAIELGKFNIRVNAIAAGVFKSEITEGLFAKAWVHEVAKKLVPLQRWGHVNPDLTSLVVFLVSDSLSYTTGNIFIVDGGYSIPGVPLWSSL